MKICKVQNLLLATVSVYLNNMSFTKSAFIRTKMFITNTYSNKYTYSSVETKNLYKTVNSIMLPT